MARHGGEKAEGLESHVDKAEVHFLADAVTEPPQPPAWPQLG